MSRRRTLWHKRERTVTKWWCCSALSWNGDIITDKDWGRKELAYKIAGETHAIYHQYELSLPADAPAKIDAVLNITDGVIRHLIVKIDEKVEKVLAEEKAARAAREAARAERERSE